MAFSARELSVLAYANGFTLWHYRTEDSWADLLASGAGYFLAADELLRPGDQIILTMLAGGLPAGGTLVVTVVRPGAVVEVAPVSWPIPVRTAPPAQSDAAAERRAAAAC